ncbi:MAG: tetratricopeptide repeat protein, partial [Myxococcota bacterium]|nr:tetratricopeptide repeat protein [Myxococcota bacterium]
LASADPSIPIAMLEKAAEAEKLTADRTALLARLQMHTGHPERAIELYERALQAGSRLHHVKNDLALLLAEQGGDLERAEKLAQVAVEAPGEQIDANDTLGYVYLKQGRPNVAYWKFRYVIDNARTPRAEYYYHLALALVEMERLEDAQAALNSSLDIDPLFEPARQLKATLDGEALDSAS